MIRLFCLAALLLLAGCDPKYSVAESYTPLQGKLSHCSFIEVRHGFKELNVIHCPYTESTLINEQQGKLTVNTSVITETKKSELHKQLLTLQKELVAIEQELNKEPVK